MDRFVTRRTLSKSAAALAVLAVAPVAATRSVFAQDTDLSKLTGKIVSDGSSNVGPITQAVAEEFAKEAPEVRISVDISGTGGGFKRFDVGETDVQNASRPIKDEEKAEAEKNGVKYIEFRVAYDGITVVVNPNNAFLTCLNVDALKYIWQKDNPAKTWADLNPDFPADTINLYGPGTDSGTFDFFTETILGADGAIREDYTPSADPNVLVQGVESDDNALAYFGHSYYEANQDALKLISIDNGKGCIEPTTDTIRDGTYAPLSRPLFVYVNLESLKRPEVAAFMTYYLENVSSLVGDVGYVAAPEEVYTQDKANLEAAIAGKPLPYGEATPEAGTEATPAS